MDIAVFDPHELPLVLSTLRSVVPRPSARHYRYLDVVARIHGGLRERRALPPAPHMLVAGVIRDGRRRKRLVQLAVLMALSDRRSLSAAAPAVTSLAEVLGVDEPAVNTLSTLSSRSRLSSCAGVIRRAVTASVGAVWRDGGVAGLSKLIRNPLALDRMQAASKRLAELAQYPQGSLGRVLWEKREKYACAGGCSDFVLSDGMTHHVGHLISGYDASPAGELQQAAFQAGYTRRDGFAHLLCGVMQFHLAIKLSPFAEPHAGLFDAHKVMTALDRGARCTADLGAGWNFWDCAPRPLAELREELCVPPLSAAVAA